MSAERQRRDVERVWEYMLLTNRKMEAILGAIHIIKKSDEPKEDVVEHVLPILMKKMHELIANQSSNINDICIELTNIYQQREKRSKKK